MYKQTEIQLLSFQSTEKCFFDIAKVSYNFFVRFIFHIF